ncbi:unnamed protein product, partial [Discosporangium mesarthrocarpum]
RASLVNLIESQLVRILIWGLASAGVNLGYVGVICPFRSQVRLLQAELRPLFPEVEVNTIDKYQGRDKQVIVVSFVRSNPEGAVGELLRDWRRLNVALSRAKAKLILLGSLWTLSQCSILSSMAGFLTGRGWVYALPPHAHEMYPGVAVINKASAVDRAIAVKAVGTGAILQKEGAGGNSEAGVGQEQGVRGSYASLEGMGKTCMGGRGMGDTSESQRGVGSTAAGGGARDGRGSGYECDKTLLAAKGIVRAGVA